MTTKTALEVTVGDIIMGTRPYKVMSKGTNLGALGDSVVLTLLDVHLDRFVYPAPYGIEAEFQVAE
jgi:hypothetical protein